MKSRENSDPRASSRPHIVQKSAQSRQSLIQAVMSCPLLSLSCISRQAVTQRSQASAHSKQVSACVWLCCVASITIGSPFSRPPLAYQNNYAHPIGFLHNYGRESMMNDFAKNNSSLLRQPVIIKSCQGSGVRLRLLF